MTLKLNETNIDGTFLDHLVTPGIILFTEQFDECVKFYRDKLGLPVWFEKEALCCLHFGSCYLMIENEGVAKSSRKTVHENPTSLRFNVDDVEVAARLLSSMGIDVEIVSYDWGTIGRFIDPDGNACSLKNADDAFFS
nr:VOC family protein [uncultured Cohaesibacter sp.]